MFAVGLVATRAFRAVVLADQRKIRVLVSKRGLVEWHDIRVSSLVICMAVRAFTSLGIAIAPVEAFTGRDVVADIFVATGAKFLLLAAIELDVTGGAFLLDVRMSCYDIARHHQRFQLCVRNIKPNDEEQQCKSGE